MESNMKQRKSKKFVLAIIVLLALCVFCAILLLDGCAAGSGAAAGGADSKNAAQTAQTNEKDAEGNMIIGSTEADAWDLKLTNRAEKSITGVAVKYPDAENHTANLMYEGSHISAGESAILKVEKRGGAGDSASAGGASAGGASAGGAQNATVASYYVDIKITFLDGTVSDLHHIDVRDTGELNIYLQGKIAYCIYQSAAAGAMVSTLELQTWWYNHDDPEAAARDAQEEEQERRRLEKLEEDLRSYEENNKKTTSQDSSTQGTSGSTSNTSGTSTENTEDVQSNSLGDDPIETNYDGPEED